MIITEFKRQNFKPTYLYIKQHTVTGKLYFGKTTKDNVEEYIGSGIHWRRHIKTHGVDKIVTLWYCLFTDIDTLVDTALKLSSELNIIESDEWLNLKPESGLDGGSFKGFNGFAGKKQTEHQRAVVTALGKTRPATDRMRENMSKVGRLPRTQSQINSSKLKAKRMGEKNSKPVIINGISYPSRTAACRALQTYPAALNKIILSQIPNKYEIIE